MILFVHKVRWEELTLFISIINTYHNKQQHSIRYAILYVPVTRTPKDTVRYNEILYVPVTRTHTVRYNEILYVPVTRTPKDTVRYNEILYVPATRTQKTQSDTMRFCMCQ